jgi:hypothetical protein
MESMTYAQKVSNLCGYGRSLKLGHATRLKAGAYPRFLVAENKRKIFKSFAAIVFNPKTLRTAWAWLWFRY